MLAALLGIFALGLTAQVVALPPAGATHCRIVSVSARQPLEAQSYQAFQEAGGPSAAVAGQVSTQFVGRVGDVQRVQVCREGEYRQHV